VKFRRFAALSVGLFLLSISLGVQALKPPLPRTKAQLAGVWVGPDMWGAVLRLELDSTGQGRLAVRERGSNGALTLYHVVLTKIDVNHLSFSVSPISKGAPNIGLYGTNEANAINFGRYMKDIGEGFGVDALLIRKNDLLSGLQDLKAADSNAPVEPAR
jgi:hypothetical protein